MPIESLIAHLRELPTLPNAFNPYSATHPLNSVRCANLARYFNEVSEKRADVLMVMEAPGYRGCRLTGIPVTSRQVMLEGVPTLGVLGEGYQDVQEAGFEAFYKEQSATIVWQTLSNLGVVPVLWNAYPLHPHQPDAPQSNRAPTKAEVLLGQPFLEEVCTLFTPQRVIAIGNVAHASLTALGIACDKVRHPAQGGKNDFVAGLTQALKHQ